MTPSYNQCGFIGAAIESVLSQEGAFEIEYFVMDGASTDGSAQVIKDYADLVAKCTWPIKCAGLSMAWVSQSDNGQAHAINQGLARATGDFIGWINSDDMYASGAFARVVEGFAKNSEADFLFGDGEVIDERGNPQWQWLSRPFNLSVLKTYHFLWNDFTNYIMQQSTFWRRGVLNQIGYLDESFHYGMDIEYWIRAGASGLRLCHIPEILGRFRLIHGTKSLSSLTAFWPDQLEIFRRYHSVRRLSKFFAFYYYNLARQHEFDLAKVLDSKDNVLERWRGLPRNDRQQLACEAERGFRLACFLIAHDLLQRGDASRASRFVASAGRRAAAELIHPFAWPYVLRRVMPAQMSRVVELVARRGIRAFRNWRYDYRYREKMVQE